MPGRAKKLSFSNSSNSPSTQQFPPTRQPCAQSSHPSPAASSAVVRYWRLFSRHHQQGRHRARARAGTSWSRRHTLRTCSRRRRIPPHLPRRYRCRGRTAVVAGVVEKKEKESPRPPRLRACAMSCAEWRNRCPGIFVFPPTAPWPANHTNGLPPPNLPHPHSIPFHPTTPSIIVTQLTPLPFSMVWRT